MANKVVDLTIRLKDGVSGVLKKIGGRLKSFTKNLFSIHTVIRGAFAATPVVAFGKAIKTAFNFETMRTQLKVLTGSTKAAADEFKRLRDFSSKTPFQIEGIVEAYRNLRIFTGEALTSQKGLELVGDAAAATGRQFDEVAYWTGRLYSALKNGDPFMDAVGAMQRMGIVGGEIRGTLTRLTESGASFGEMWQVVEKDLNRFNGGMIALSSTGNGLISTLKDNWTIAVATFGDAFMESAKGGIQTMIDTIKGLVEDGTITKWAEQAKSALDAVIQTIQIIRAGGEGKEQIIARLIDVLKAGFAEAAAGAISLLAKAAPLIGHALGSAAKEAIKGGVIEREGERRASIEVFGTEKPSALQQLNPSNMIKFKKAYDRIAETLTESDAMAIQGNRLADSIGDMGGNTKQALAKFLETIDQYKVKLPEATEQAAEDVSEPLSTTLPKNIGIKAAEKIEKSAELEKASEEIADAISDNILDLPSISEPSDVSAIDSGSLAEGLGIGFSSPSVSQNIDTNANDLFRSLTARGLEGGGGLTTTQALEEIKNLLGNNPEQMAEALGTALKDVFSTETVMVESESIRSVLASQKTILEDIYQLQQSRLGGVLN